MAGQPQYGAHYEADEHDDPNDVEPPVKQGAQADAQGRKPPLITRAVTALIPAERSRA
jgi:hypothetical protein